MHKLYSQLPPITIDPSCPHAGALSFFVKNELSFAIPCTFALANCATPLEAPPFFPPFFPPFALDLAPPSSAFSFLEVITAAAASSAAVRALRWVSRMAKLKSDTKMKHWYKDEGNRRLTRTTPASLHTPPRTGTVTMSRMPLSSLPLEIIAVRVHFSKQHHSAFCLPFRISSFSSPVSVPSPSFANPLSRDRNVL